MLVGEVAVAVVHELAEIHRRESLFRIALVGLPLGALLPESAALADLVAPAGGIVARGAVRDRIGIDLILEAVADLVGDGAAHGLAGGRIDPEAADGVVISSAVGHPFGRVVEVDLHLVLVQVGLALPRLGELQDVDVHAVELLGLFQQVVDVHVHRVALSKGLGGGVLRSRLGAVQAVGAVALLPEQEEVLALLAAAPGPLDIGTEHVIVELPGLVILVQVRDVRRGQDEHRHVLDDGEFLLRGPGDDPAGDAAAGAFVGLGGEGDAGRLGGLAGSLAGGKPLLRLLGDLQRPFVVAGEDERPLGPLFGAQRDGVVGRKGDGGLVGVHLLLLLRFHRHGFRLCTGKDRDDGHHGN